jgi:hypothetical protein
MCEERFAAERATDEHHVTVRITVGLPLLEAHRRGGGTYELAEFR